MRQVKFCLAVVLVGSAVVYDIVFERWNKSDLVRDIASVWNSEIYEPINGPSKVAVGVNTNLDMIVPAIELLKALNASTTSPRDHSSINSTAELEQLVGFSMLHCAGIERMFTDMELFINITNTATSLDHIYHIGGNAALMAEKIKYTRSTIQVLLIGVIGSRLKSLLNDGIITPTYTGSSKEEIHMILEYTSGTKWGQVTSSCANRVIFSHDLSNSRMVALELFDEAMNNFRPDLAVLSGAHLMEGQQQEFWGKRLVDISTLLETTLKSVPVHWELASVGNMNFFVRLSENLFPRVESLGLNEQELLSIAKSSKAPFNFTIIPQKPGIAWVSDMLHWLMQTYSSIGDKHSVLSRVHLHSLSFHVIATVDGGPWSNNKEAVMAGARVAGLQACETDTYNSSAFEIITPEEFHVSKTDTSLVATTMTLRNGWTRWFRAGISYHFSPVLVCKKPTKTVGLGDAISALGLLYSQYNNH